MSFKRKRMQEDYFLKHLWNKLHLQIIYYGREYSPARGWDIEKDKITRTIGRKSLSIKKALNT